MPKPTQTSRRFLSADALRGLTIAFMILVNDPGDWRHTFPPLEHADWNGWTPTDLIFPNFLFLVGCSIVFAVDARRRRDVPNRVIAVQMLRRALLLFLIRVGLALLPNLLHGSLGWTHMRLFGVLTRIALCYLIAGLIYLITRRVAVLAGIAAVLLAGYWALLRFVPVPGFGLPGRDVPFLNEAGNLTSYLDRAFSGWTMHWLHTGTTYRKVSDPEGLLSTLPSVATTLLGVIAGVFITRGTQTVRRALGLVVAGALCLGAGLLWNGSFAINKNLWTSSFVLLAGGFSLIGLGVAHALVDRTGPESHPAWLRVLLWPLLVFGSNAIVAYVVAEMLIEIASAIPLPGGPGHNLLRFLYTNLFAAHGSTEVTSLLFAIAFVAVCFVPNWLLWRKRIFVRV